jgi:hypothetical protein
MRNAEWDAAYLEANDLDSQTRMAEPIASSELGDRKPSQMLLHVALNWLTGRDVYSGFDVFNSQSGANLPSLLLASCEEAGEWGDLGN